MKIDPSSNAAPAGKRPAQTHHNEQFFLSREKGLASVFVWLISR
jgi:hypothetical protein